MPAPFASEASRLRLSPAAGRRAGPGLLLARVSPRHDLPCAGGRPAWPAAAGPRSFLAWLALRRLSDALRRLAARFARSAADGSRNLAAPAVPA
jgi:hypothetical protein